MAVVNQILHRKNSSGSYDTVYLQANMANVTGTLAVANGGTGATSAEGARSNLGITPANIGAAASSHNHSASNITSGTLAVARGGTGATTLADVVTNLGVAPRAFFKNTGSARYIKIDINDTNNWMLSAVIRIYQDYTPYDVLICGYNYNSAHWYSPNAVLLGSTAQSIDVIFGYDADNKLWVAFEGNRYIGVEIVGGSNGYNSAPLTKDYYSISFPDTLTGTIQTTTTAYRPLRVNEYSTYTHPSTKQCNYSAVQVQSWDSSTGTLYLN